MHGARAGFTRGIWFPHDAIVQSQLLAQSLLAAPRSPGAKGSILVQEGTRVTRIDDLGKTARVFMRPDGASAADVASLEVAQVVVATGGFFSESLRLPVSRFIRPCWSYLVTIPVDPAKTAAVAASAAGGGGGSLS